MQHYSTVKLLKRTIAENSIGASLALVTLFIFIMANILGGYGYFRDELYYIACTDHLALGYVDHPPLSIFLLRINRFFLGDSLFALRFLPALAGAALVYLTGRLAIDLGSGKTAQFLACTAVIIAPVYLAVGSFYSMNVFEPLFWMGAALILIRIINTGKQKLWLLFGVIAGFGILNKHSMLFFCMALAAGIFLTPQRREFRSGMFWGGVSIAFFIILPNIFWQLGNDWATLEFMRNAQQWKNLPMSPVDFILAQILFQHPFTLPLWLLGVAAFLLFDGLRKYRAFGWMFIILLIFFIVQRGKPYYLSPVYPVLLCGGAIAVERFFARWNIRKLAYAYPVVLMLGGAATLPLWLPVLPVETFIRYSTALHMQPPKMERHDDTPFPQVFADRFGWEELVSETAKVYHALSQEERSQAAIYAQNYGEAGAIDFFGGRYGLPKALCGHNSYWHWGTHGSSGKILIIIGGREEDHRKTYESVEQVALHRNAYAMPFETNLPIFVCRKPKVPLGDVWPEVKKFI